MTKGDQNGRRRRGAAWIRGFRGTACRTRNRQVGNSHCSRTDGGTGLGLAIAAELVRAHGGELRLVEGTIGATFRIAIPDRPIELQAARNERIRA